jgi:hypothetical protein
MKGLSKREKSLLLLLGVVLIGYLYYSLFYTPIQKKIGSTKLNIDKYIHEISDAKTNKKLFEQQTSELENIKAKYEEAKVVLPQMEMNPQIVYNIQKFFQGSGVEVTSITIGEPEDLQNQSTNTETKADKTNSQNSTTTNNTNQEGTGKLLTVPVTITLSADNYAEVMKFISLFENDRRFAEITNIVITANRPAPQPVAKSTTKPKVIEKQTDNNAIEVVVVGEGEEYKEIPVDGSSNEDTAQQEIEASQPEQNVINVDETKPKIEVSITARYYYVDTNANEQPDYSFKNGVYGKKDLFKE